MTQHSQNGEGVEVIHDSANSHCFDDQIMVAGECIAFASEPWSSKIVASLTAREPATADVGREDADLLADANAWYSQAQMDEIAQTVEDAFREGFNEGADNQQRGYGYSQTPSHYAAADKKSAWEDSDAKKALAALSRAAPSSGHAMLRQSGAKHATLCANLADKVPIAGEPDPHWWERQSALREASVILSALAALSPSSGHAMAEGEREINCAVCGESVKHTSAGYCFSCIKGFKVPLTTTPPTTNDAIPAGMVRWDGGDRAPEDWDGGPVLRRHGGMSMPDGEFAWSSNGGGLGNVVAYRPKIDIAAEMTAFEAAYSLGDHTKYRNGEVVAGRVRYAKPEVDKMFSAWLSARAYTPKPSPTPKGAE